MSHPDALPVSLPELGTYLSERQRSPRYWLLPSSTGARSFHCSTGPARSTEFSGSCSSPAMERTGNLMRNFQLGSIRLICPNFWSKTNFGAVLPKPDRNKIGLTINSVQLYLADTGWLMLMGHYCTCPASQLISRSFPLYWQQMLFP